MRLFSYVIAYDYGFAPNPFFRVCTLATCKPRIRAAAKEGDWIIGTGSKKRGLAGHLICAMRVTETVTFDDYWTSPRFREKRPLLSGSLKQRYGDNIYHRDGNGNWIQENSHHSLEGGKPNKENIKRDTGYTTRVLISTDYSYWGRDGPKIPAKFRDDPDVCCSTQGHKSEFSDKLVAAFVGWVTTQGIVGFAGNPAEFP